MKIHRVILLHGRASNPESPKIKALLQICKALDLSADAPDFSSTQNPETRVQMLSQLCSSERNSLLLVGSSMGGYVATRASQSLHVEGLFLIAPAFYLPNYPSTSILPKATLIEIVHGWNDDVVPVDNSIRFAREHAATLHVVPVRTH